jgi:hypothetical protein
METNTFTTYDAVGIREDLIDVIYDISPTDTPFVSNVASGKSKGTYHEWQIDSLADPEDNPVPEGADASQAAVTPTVRVGNYCQINSRVFGISGTDMVADNAGRGVEMAYQEAKKGLELRKSVEYTTVFVNKGYAAGTGVAPTREAGTVQAWIATNFVTATDGVAPTGDGSDPKTDGATQGAFDETLLEEVIDKIYLEGGSPDIIMANTQQKRVITNTFRGSTDQNRMSTDAKRIVNAVDFYESDYGTLSVVPNRYMPQDCVYVLDTDMWEIAYHRPYQTYDLAKTGDNESKQMIVEWTLVSRQEASSGAIYDLTNV